MLRVIIADDEPLVRRGIRTILDSNSGLAEVVGEAATGDEAVVLARSLKPDLVLLDIRMPGGDGITAAQQIRMFSPSTRIVVLTAYPDFTYAQKMLRLGASDYLLKPSSPASILGTIERVAQDVGHTGEDFLLARDPESALHPQGGSLIGPGPFAQGKMRRRGVIASARKYIAENLGRSLTLSEVADSVGLSPWYFSSIFKTEVGCSFRDYLSRLRVEAGKRALLETDLIIREIAQNVGYSEPSHFTQAFKRIVGVTPRQFLKGEGRVDKPITSTRNRKLTTLLPNSE